MKSLNSVDHSTCLSSVGGGLRGIWGEGRRGDRLEKVFKCMLKLLLGCWRGEKCWSEVCGGGCGKGVIGYVGVEGGEVKKEG